MIPEDQLGLFSFNTCLLGTEKASTQDNLDKALAAIGRRDGGDACERREENYGVRHGLKSVR
jgi:hypothetical protein